MSRKMAGMSYITRQGKKDATIHMKRTKKARMISDDEPGDETNPPSAEKMFLSRPDSRSQIQCPSWGGEGMVNDVTVTLRNTCTIDNLMTENTDILSNLMNRCDETSKTLVEIIHLVDKSEWADAKIKWLTRLCEYGTIDDGVEWDTFGSEADMVVQHLAGFTRILPEIIMLGERCPTPLNTIHSLDISMK